MSQSDWNCPQTFTNITQSQDYEADHRDIDLLRLRNFTIGKKIPDTIFTAEDGQEQIVDIVRAMVGFVSLSAVKRMDRWDIPY